MSASRRVPNTPRRIDRVLTLRAYRYDIISVHYQLTSLHRNPPNIFLSFWKEPLGGRSTIYRITTPSPNLEPVLHVLWIVWDPLLAGWICVKCLTITPSRYIQGVACTFTSSEYHSPDRQIPTYDKLRHIPLVYRLGSWFGIDGHQLESADSHYHTKNYNRMRVSDNGPGWYNFYMRVLIFRVMRVRCSMKCKRTICLVNTTVNR